MVKEMSILTFFNHKFHNIPIQYDTEKRLKAHLLTPTMEFRIFSNFQTLSSKDDQSNESKKYVKNNFYTP